MRGKGPAGIVLGSVFHAVVVPPLQMVSARAQVSSGAREASMVAGTGQRVKSAQACAAMKLRTCG
ncbi:hypothetical protein GCM10007886_34360 [Methylobacterium gregans]|nr:hypothetical protein GCM10007886_34360 [Methylobacterium gregans]